MFDYDAVIRKVPDFPKPGILFYDITSLISEPSAVEQVQKSIDELFDPSDYDALLGVESRGFIFASIAAHRLNKPMYLARKPGKLPNEIVSQSYDLEYGSATLEMQKIDLQKGGRWLVIDDLIATGGTLEATCSMIEGSNVEIAGIFSVIGLPFLGYEEKLRKYNVKTLINYDSE
jgi:adenine phosphoribosyltransferase